MLQLYHMKQTYVTTNVRIPKALHIKLKHLALENEQSFGELVRELLYAVDTHKNQKKPSPSRYSYENDPIWDLINYTVDSKESDLSSRVDEIVYR